LRFQHPATGSELRIESALAPDCQRFLDSLTND
jgi:hypothetical protein